MEVYLIMSEISIKIRERRIQLGLSQEELALQLGYKSKSTINKIEMGINDIPQAKISLFAKALQTTPAYLLGLTDINAGKISIENNFENADDLNRFLHYFQKLQTLDTSQQDLIYEMIDQMALPPTTKQTSYPL